MDVVFGWKMTHGNKEWMKPKYASPVACLAKTSKLFRSLRRECLFVHRNQGFFLSVHVDDIKIAGKKQNMCHMWKKWMKLVDLGELTSFLDHVYLGCTQRGCKSNGGITNLCQTNSKKSWLGEIARGYSRLVLWYGKSCDKMRGKILRIGEKGWANKLDDHQFKKEELVG